VLVEGQALPVLVGASLAGPPSEVAQLVLRPPSEVVRPRGTATGCGSVRYLGW
jgi:hypothetical protein